MLAEREGPTIRLSLIPPLIASEEAEERRSKARVLDLRWRASPGPGDAMLRVKGLTRGLHHPDGMRRPPASRV